jgi:diacylglycerol kinase family enzyme
MHIAPAADVRDGLLDLVVIDAANRRRLVTALPKVYDGSHVDLDGVHVLRGRAVSLRATAHNGGSVPVGGDGEPIGDLPHVSAPAATIEVLPRALTVLV